MEIIAHRVCFQDFNLYFYPLEVDSRCHNAPMFYECYMLAFRADERIVHQSSQLFQTLLLCKLLMLSYLVSGHKKFRGQFDTKTSMACTEVPYWA